MRMSALLDKAIEKLYSLSPEEQDEVASQILAEIEDEQAWREGFAQKQHVLRRLAQDALSEDARGETFSISDVL